MGHRPIASRTLPNVHRRLLALCLLVAFGLACADRPGSTNSPRGTQAKGVVRQQSPILPSNGRLTEPDRVLTAVYAQLFAYRRFTVQGSRANLFFLAVGELGELADPDSQVLAQLASPEFRVYPQSASTFDIGRGVRDRTTDELGLLFYASTICVDGENAFVRAGYVEHGKSGMRFILFLRHVDGAWKVMEVGRIAIA